MSDKNQPSGELIHHQLFATPVYERFFPKFHEHKEGLIEYVNELRKTDSGVTRSNQGGWHSSDEIHTSDNVHMKWLISRIYQVMSSIIIARSRDPITEEHVHMVAAWFNVNAPGQWNAPHAHTPCDWSGVIYIDVDDEIQEEHKAIQDGDLVFFNPLLAGNKARHPPTQSVRPKTGNLVMFPSDILHMVAPHGGDRERISMAFNMKITPPNVKRNVY